MPKPSHSMGSRPIRFHRNGRRPQPSEWRDAMAKAADHWNVAWFQTHGLFSLPHLLEETASASDADILVVGVDHYSVDRPYRRGWDDVYAVLDLPHCGSWATCVLRRLAHNSHRLPHTCGYWHRNCDPDSTEARYPGTDSYSEYTSSTPSLGRRPRRGSTARETHGNREVRGLCPSSTYWLTS